MNDIESKLLHLANSYQPSTTAFLTKEEQVYLSSQTNDLVFIGGYKNPERVRASVFGAPTDVVTVFKIDYPKAYLTLKHQQILGTLIALGIKRDAIGDILVEEDAFVISKELAPFIQTAFTSINQVPITLSEVDLSHYEYQQSYIDFKTTLDSMRLDLLVSKITKYSREQAKFAIINGDVKINHNVVTKATKKLQEEDILSIRKFGRFVIVDTKGRSKKGKIVLKYKKYD